MQLQLEHLKIGSKGRIVHVSRGADKAYRHKLIAMGLLPGTEFTVSSIAPFGDPIEIIIRGFCLSLRKKEASLLQIEEVLP